MDTLKEKAVNWIDSGFRVFPLYGITDALKCECAKADCGSPGKHPRILEWQKEASNDPAIIKEWWDRWPNANIGLPTGDINGFIVMDLDGPEGVKTARENGIPKTPTVKTGRGWQIFFRYPGQPVKSRTGVFTLMDSKADGGYVVAAGSKHHTGAIYEWAPGRGLDIPLATVPEWWLAAISNLVATTNAHKKQTSSTILEGTRNQALASLGGSMRRKGFSQGAIESALLAVNEAECSTPLSATEIHGIATSIARYDAMTPMTPKSLQAKSQATRIIHLASDLELFHDQDRCFAFVPNQPALGALPLKSTAFEKLLAERFFKAEDSAAPSAAISDAIAALEGKAQFQSPEARVYVRVGGVGEALYFDLGTPGIIEIAPDGWKVLESAPIKFIHPRGFYNLPRPEKGGSLEGLRALLNIVPEEWPLLLGWLVASMRNTGPYPILALQGEQGTGKTFLAKMLREIVDPSMAAVRAEPRDTHDLVIAAENSWVLNFDNISKIPHWLSDAFCRLSTGGGFSTRELYTNRDEAIFEVQRPCIINGISDIVERADLLDRALILHPQPIKKNRRRTEADLWSTFRASRPLLLGALLDAVSTALKRLPEIKMAFMPRMADFALWAVAAEPALGLPSGAFLEAYESNQRGAADSLLDDSVIYRPITSLLEAEHGSWQGTASALHKALTDTQKPNMPYGWPHNGQKLSNALRRLAPALRASSVDVTFKRTAGGRMIELRNSVIGVNASLEAPRNPVQGTAFAGA